MILKKVILTFINVLLSLLCVNHVFSQIDTAKVKSLAEDAKLRSVENKIRMSIQQVDISRFPNVKLIVEAVNADGSAIDNININEFNVVENEEIKKVVSVNKIVVDQKIPIDFVFVIDVTATMGPFIKAIKDNIESFTKKLDKKGIDFTISLVTFNDFIDKVYDPTKEVSVFNKWLSGISALGGYDDKENALEALNTACQTKFRPFSNKIAILISDAPYHQSGEQGRGKTNFSSESMGSLLKKKEIRLFSIVPSVLKGYKIMADSTRGAVFDISQPFAKILDDYSTQLTNLFAITYRSDKATIPDSLSVGIVDQKKREIVKKTISVIELGRRLIIENLLFPTNSSVLPDSVYELEILRQFMTNKTNFSVRIEGHTDSKGNKRLNKRLSLKRAEAVRQYLIKKGIAPTRIIAAGYGDTKPIADNTTEFGRRLNRRTEVVIIGK
jgi:outer membrane protein OmpA-like peptidoglycan-associated protein